MNHSRLWIVIGSLGFVALACGIVMAFLSEHHWYVTYQIALFLERALWWFQLAGGVLSVIGCVGMATTLTKRAALRVGVALILAGLFLALFSGVHTHDWEVSLLLPVLLVLLDGAMLWIVGSIRGET